MEEQPSHLDKTAAQELIEEARREQEDIEQNIENIKSKLMSFDQQFHFNQSNGIEVDGITRK